MKYLIDHTTQLIHRASQISDACHVHTTVANEREMAQEEAYIKQLESNNYKKCEQCHMI
ncbi:hypothetical protein [Bacillus sp. JCM 19041]|uniref:hypothetical protein n=1 Tax=Bacillus sp. JCM 19041 TaxID=1460637 RepID=UPI000A9BBC9B